RAQDALANAGGVEPAGLLRPCQSTSALRYPGGGSQCGSAPSRRDRGDRLVAGGRQRQDGPAHRFGIAPLERTASLSARLMMGAALIAVIPLAALTVAFTVLARREIRKQLDVALLARAQNFAGLVQSSILDPLSRDTALREWAANSAVLGAL